MRFPFLYCPACASPRPELADGKALHCPACGLHYYQNVAATAGVFIRHQDHILFAVRARNPGAGMLDLPGGFVDPGESLEQGLRREIGEELGIDLPNVVYLFSFANTYQYKGVVYRTADALFEANVEHRPEVYPADDVAKVHWKRLADVQLQEVAFESIRGAIIQLRKRQAPYGRSR